MGLMAESAILFFSGWVGHGSSGAPHRLGMALGTRCLDVGGSQQAGPIGMVGVAGQTSPGEVGGVCSGVIFLFMAFETCFLLGPDQEGEGWGGVGAVASSAFLNPKGGMAGPLLSCGGELVVVATRAQGIALSDQVGAALSPMGIVAPGTLALEKRQVETTTICISVGQILMAPPAEAAWILLEQVGLGTPMGFVALSTSFQVCCADVPSFGGNRFGFAAMAASAEIRAHISRHYLPFFNLVARGAFSGGERRVDQGRKRLSGR